MTHVLPLSSPWCGGHGRREGGGIRGVAVCLRTASVAAQNKLLCLSYGFENSMNCIIKTVDITLIGCEAGPGSWRGTWVDFPRTSPRNSFSEGYVCARDLLPYRVTRRSGTGGEARRMRHDMLVYMRREGYRIIMIYTGRVRYARVVCGAEYIEFDVQINAPCLLSCMVV
jgi:hypothetical protein